VEAVLQKSEYCGSALAFHSYLKVGERTGSNPVVLTGLNVEIKPSSSERARATRILQRAVTDMVNPRCLECPECTPTQEPWLGRCRKLNVRFYSSRHMLFLGGAEGKFGQDGKTEYPSMCGIERTNRSILPSAYTSFRTQKRRRTVTVAQK